MKEQNNAVDKQGNNEKIANKQKIGCGVITAIIVFIIVIIAITNGEKGNDGKCDICGDKAVYESSSGDLCLKHVLWANNEYYKNNDNYGGF